MAAYSDTTKLNLTQFSLHSPFTLAIAFLVLTLVWLGTNIYWRVTHSNCVNTFDFIVGILFVAAAAGMVYNEYHKKKRKHLDEVDKYKIP